MNSKIIKAFRFLSAYDYWLLGSFTLMLCVSMILIASAGSAVAISHQWSSFLFIKKHVFFMFVSLAVCAICMFINSDQIVKWGYFCLVFGMLGVIATFFIGVTIKGAHRWINFFGLSLQPSEIMKLGCVIVTAHLISRQEYKKCALIVLSNMLLLFGQPDFGSLVLLSGILLVMAFLDGLRWSYIFAGIGLLLGVCAVSYFTLPHVFKRVEVFMNKKEDKYGSNYQIIKATQTIKAGGLLGKGPGEGKLKYYLPDAHADFIFAVAGEEFGMLGTSFIVVLYAVVLFRVFAHAVWATERRKFLLIVGLGSLFLLQAWFNILSNLALIPTKGFTLPIIGYGGSGLGASMCAAGMLLNLTRKQNYGKVLRKFDY